MGTSDREHRRRIEEAVRQGVDPKELEKLNAQEMQKLEEGGQLDNQAAQRLQPQLGNQAVKELMGQQKSNEQAGAELEIVEEEELEVAEEIIEDSGEKEGMELDHPQLGGGGGGGGGEGGGGGPPGTMPWEQGQLFGGDDDEDDDRPRNRRVRPGARGPAGAWVGPPAREDPEDILEEEDIEALDDRLLDEAREAPTDRRGDAAYLAIEAALSDPRRLGRRQLDPEGLIDTTGPMDPIGRATGIGRFLSTKGESLLGRSVARLLTRSLAVLAPEEGGHAGAVGRLAGLAVSAEVMEGGGVRTDRAVQLSLMEDAWSDGMRVARDLGIEGLRAHLVFDRIRAMRKLPPPPAPLGDSPTPGHLTLAALEAVVPQGPMPTIPHLELLRPPPPVEEDEEMAAVDAVLARFTGGEDPGDLPVEPVVDREDLLPMMRSVDQLLSTLGRTQVELGAAAAAAYRLHQAPLRPVLSAADRELRGMARRIVTVARGIQGLDGQPVAELGSQPEELTQAMVELAQRFTTTRRSVLAQLAGALDA